MNIGGIISLTADLPVDTYDFKRSYSILIVSFILFTYFSLLTVPMAVAGVLSHCSRLCWTLPVSQ